MRMRRTVRTAWVEALRSGEYPQAKGGLATVNPNGTDAGYCCLGVLCEVARKGGVPVHRGAPEKVLTTGESYRPYDGQLSFPPSAVAAWVGPEGESWEVAVPDDDYEGRVMHDSLADLNDHYGFTFAEIADAIENDLDAADDVRDDLEVATP